MPFKSQAQRRKFYAMEDRGEISSETLKKWEEETPKGKKLPEHVKKAVAYALSKRANGEVEGDEPPPIPGKQMPTNALKAFFKNNPAPQDAQVHELAEAYRVDPHVLEGQAYRMLGDKLKTAGDLIPGGKADDKPDSAFNAAQLAQGVKVEMEHTDNPRLAKEIARDHLEEFGNYYTALDKMEKRLEAEKEGKTAYHRLQRALLKTAEPPPPKGVSSKEWDKILQGLPKSRKSAYYSTGMKLAMRQLGLL